MEKYVDATNTLQLGLTVDLTLFDNGTSANYQLLEYSGFPQKSENGIPWLFHDWFAFFHDSHSHIVSDMVMIVSHNMHDNHKLEGCHSHEKKQFHDFSRTFWEIFIFQDFSMTFHDSNFFQDFPWLWEPWYYSWMSKLKGDKDMTPLLVITR